MRVTDDADINLAPSTYIEFTNTLMSHVEIFRNWLERCCIMLDGI